MSATSETEGGESRLERDTRGTGVEQGRGAGGSANGGAPRDAARAARPMRLGWRRYVKGAYTIWYRDFVRLRRDRMRIIGSLGMPMLYLFVLGTGLGGSMSGFGGGGLDYRQFIFSGILSMTILFTSIFSAISIIWDREFGFLKEVMVAPVPRVAVALGKVAGGATVALFQGVIVLLLAPLVGVKLGFGQVVALLGLMLLLASVMTALGVLLAARQRSMEGFQMIMNFLVMPMYFLSGALYPLTNLPLWLAALGRIDPVTYGVDPLRQVALQESVSSEVLRTISLHPVAVDVGVMAVLGVLFVVPAVWLFGRQE